MSGHTPGPWKIILDRVIKDSDLQVFGIEAEDGTKIVETDCGIYPPYLEDAKLITAAPEMLDILKRVILFDNAKMRDYHRGCCCEICVVIAKAEGKI